MGVAVDGLHPGPVQLQVTGGVRPHEAEPGGRLPIVEIHRDPRRPLARRQISQLVLAGLVAAHRQTHLTIDQPALGPEPRWFVAADRQESRLRFRSGRPGPRVDSPERDGCGIDGHTVKLEERVLRRPLRIELLTSLVPDHAARGVAADDPHTVTLGRPTDRIVDDHAGASVTPDRLPQQLCLGGRGLHAAGPLGVLDGQLLSGPFGNEAVDAVVHRLGAGGDGRPVGRRVHGNRREGLPRRCPRSADQPEQALSPA